MVSSKPKVKGSREILAAFEDPTEKKLFSKVHYFCSILGLSASQVVQNSTDSYKEIEAEADQRMFEEVIERLSEDLDKIIEKVKEEHKVVNDTKWFKNDFEGVFEFIFEHAEKVATSSPLALLDLGLYFYGTSARSFLIHLASWFITHAEMDLITSNVLLNKVANKYHREYIARLPSEELFEFLVSDKAEARVMARNKIKMLESQNCED